MSKATQRELLWSQAKKRYRLNAQNVAKAKRLGINPKKLGSLANHQQEPWKRPLKQWLQERYEERFGDE